MDEKTETLPRERLADALGDVLIALAGTDRDAVRRASQHAAYMEAQCSRRGGSKEGGEWPGLFATIYAAEMVFAARAARRAAGLTDEAHAAALVAIETVIENELDALRRPEVMTEADGKAVA